MNTSRKTAYANASKLGDLLARLPLNPPGQWSEIESTARNLADDLRVKDVEQQTTLGKTLLPQTLTSLLKGALDGASIPSATCAPAIFEILRVGANLCMDHDENRSCLLEAGFPQGVVSLLEGYAESIPENRKEPMPLSIPDLKVVKTAIGVLLNASVGYEPIKFRLISLEAAMTILKLSMALYPPGSWLNSQPQNANGDIQGDAIVLESWNIRSTLTSWAWRVISELRGEDEETPQNQPLFGPDALPWLTQPLHAFIPPYASPSAPFAALPPRRALVQADFDVLVEVCGILESMAMDIEDVRLSLARGFTFPEEHGGIPCLSDMLTFVDSGEYPPFWSAEAPADRTTREKGFDTCKAAIVKVIVEVAGDQKNIDTLWDDSDEAHPGGPFVEKMVSWIRSQKNLRETTRDDLIMCATLSLGNLVRREAHSLTITRPPISLVPDLAAVLEPDLDIKVKHGIVGLLKHLAQSQGCRAALGEAGVIHRLATAQVWGEKTDMIEIVQVSAIGVAKHMCNGDVNNTFALTEAPDSATPSALDQILALVRRSDSIAVKSEGTRVLVNVIKTLWSSSTSTPDLVQRRQTAMQTVLTSPCAAALAQLIGRSRKYPILINEGVVALSLLSTHAQGGTLVLDAILNPLPTEALRQPQSQPMSAAPSEGSPAVTGPKRALDMLITVLRNSDNSIQVEVCANVCTLLGHLGRKGVVAEDRIADVERLKDSTRELLEQAAKAQDANSRSLTTAAKRALEAWS